MAMTKHGVAAAKRGLAGPARRLAGKARMSAVGWVAAAAMLGVMAGANAQQHDMKNMKGMNAQGGQMRMADTGASSLSVSDCWVRALPAPAPSAGYFVIHNGGAHQVMLTGAASDAFGMVMLHRSIEKGGMSEMKMVHDVPVPAGGALEFKPGGYHAMLEKPVGKLVIGSHIELDLSFDSGAAVTANCVVKPANTLAN
jgi:copper(I)-binding protein